MLWIITSASLSLFKSLIKQINDNDSVLFIQTYYQVSTFLLSCTPQGFHFQATLADLLSHVLYSQGFHFLFTLACRSSRCLT